MSGGGGGIIIIRNLIDNPGTSADEKARLRAILDRCQQAGECSLLDRWRVARVVYALLGRS